MTTAGHAWHALTEAVVDSPNLHKMPSAPVTDPTEVVYAVSILMAACRELAPARDAMTAGKAPARSGARVAKAPPAPAFVAAVVKNASAAARSVSLDELPAPRRAPFAVVKAPCTSVGPAVPASRAAVACLNCSRGLRKDGLRAAIVTRDRFVLPAQRHVCVCVSLAVRA